MSRMSESVGASTSRNPKGLQGLYRGKIYILVRITITHLTAWSLYLAFGHNELLDQGKWHFGIETDHNQYLKNYVGQIVYKLTVTNMTMVRNVDVSGKFKVDKICIQAVNCPSKNIVIVNYSIIFVIWSSERILPVIKFESMAILTHELNCITSLKHKHTFLKMTDSKNVRFIVLEVSSIGKYEFYPELLIVAFLMLGPAESWSRGQFEEAGRALYCVSCFICSGLCVVVVMMAQLKTVQDKVYVVVKGSLRRDFHSPPHSCHIVCQVVYVWTQCRQ
jgi:hypothetical protein